jgi:hypothetical protein
MQSRRQWRALLVNWLAVDLHCGRSTLPAVRNAGWILLAVLLIGGCSSSLSSQAPPSPSNANMFAPVAMRIHPFFTRIKDWTGDNYPDGIDALIEFQDQFGDATKASGTVIFELYDFNKYDAERKGQRICNPWVGTLTSADDQRLRWNRTSRTYSFPLGLDTISASSTYVLTAEFQKSGGGRFYDQIVLEPPQGAYAPKGYQAPTTTVATQPSATQPSTTQPTTESTTQPSGSTSPAPSSGPVTLPTSTP